MAPLPLARVLVLTGTCLLLTGGPAAAGEPAGASDEEVERRLAFIEARLDRHRTHARVWQWSWTAVNGGAAIGLGVLGALADSDEDRVNLFTQSALGLVGLADLHWMRRMPARDGFDPMRRMPAATPAERRVQLERAEAMLRRAAARPSGRSHWWLHLGNVALNTAVGLGVWAAGDGTGGLISAASGVVGGELYLWSEPYGWKDDLRDYERFVSGTSAAPEPRWSLTLGPGGLSLRWEF